MPLAAWALDANRSKFDSTKSLTDQVSEIEKLIFDAQQQLSQATYALDTLRERIQRSATVTTKDAAARSAQP